MVPTGNDQESNKTLVSVDDEISSHLFSLFVMCDKLGRGKVAKVTASGLSRYRI
jgi:hypothetical protein